MPPSTIRRGEREGGGGLGGSMYPHDISISIMRRQSRCEKSSHVFSRENVGKKEKKRKKKVQQKEKTDWYVVPGEYVILTYFPQTQMPEAAIDIYKRQAR